MKPVDAARGVLFALTSLYLLQSLPASTQQPISGTGISISNTPNRRDSFDLPETTPAERHNIEKIRQTERQRRMIADTNRLLALTADLKANLDKAPQGQPSADLIKKTEEIEKLARSVKDRMKG